MTLTPTSAAASEERITLDARSTCVVVIDPQVGFCSPEGSLARKYGLEETAPLRRAAARLTVFLERLPDEVAVAVVTSRYAPGQFAPDDSADPMYWLCVPGANADCALAPGLDLRSHWRRAEKHQKDAWTAPAFSALVAALRRKGRDTFVITGFVFTSCVRAAVLGSFRHASGDAPDRIIVPMDLTGSRLSSHAAGSDGSSRVQAVMRELSAVGALVTASDRLYLET
jgi:nicotinamidase-related amidase